MRADEAAADRAAEVRAAARSWADAGCINATTRAAIDDRYPDDRTRLTPGLRVLAFVLTLIAGLLLFAFFALTADGGSTTGFAILAAVAALLAAVATSYQRGALGRADAGAENATLLLTLGFAALAVGLAVDAVDLPLRIALVLTVAPSALAAARWGGAIPGVIAASAFLVLLADLPPGRLPWIGGSAVMAALLLRAAPRAALAPGQRTASRWAAAVLLVALYVGVNPLSVEQGWVEQWWIDFRGGVFAPAPVAPLAWLGALLLPVLLMVAGLRRRELLLLALAAAMLLATIATVRWYQPVLPLAYALLLGGVAVAGGALLLRRWLRAGAGGERGGFTADPLWSDRNGTTAIQAVLRAAPLAPGAAPAAPVEPERGGRFAGGGASGEF